MIKSKKGKPAMVEENHFLDFSIMSKFLHFHAGSQTVGNYHGTEMCFCYLTGIFFITDQKLKPKIFWGDEEKGLE